MMTKRIMKCDMNVKRVVVDIESCYMAQVFFMTGGSFLLKDVV